MAVAIEIETHQIDVTRIVEDVFRTMLNVEVCGLTRPGPPEPNSVTSAVHFVGEWKGVVLLQCGLPEALAFTARLAPAHTPSGLDEDVRDVLGELVNMVGGNLKSVLPSGVALSIPTVVAGSDYAMHICGGNAFHTVGFSSELGLFWITLVQVLEKN